jgi:c-di-GMP-binding flagellar brake protein YcgR
MHDSVKTAERRMYRRLDVTLDGSFSKLNFLDYGPTRVPATVKNISAVGLYLETEKPLPLGSLVEVEFYLRGKKNRVKAEAMVRWINRDDAGSDLGMGVEFLTKN